MTTGIKVTQAYTQGKNDCVIVTLANQLNITYENVILAAKSIGVTPETIAKRGVNTDEIDKLLIRLCPYSIWQVRNPRRGQEKITGFVRWHPARGRPGHMNYIKAGAVVDTDGWVFTLDSYRATYRYKMHQVWVRIRMF